MSVRSQSPPLLIQDPVPFKRTWRRRRGVMEIEAFDPDAFRGLNLIRRVFGVLFIFNTVVLTVSLLVFPSLYFFAVAFLATLPGLILAGILDYAERVLRSRNWSVRASDGGDAVEVRGMNRRGEWGEPELAPLNACRLELRPVRIKVGALKIVGHKNTVWAGTALVLRVAEREMALACARTRAEIDLALAEMPACLAELPLEDGPEIRQDGDIWAFRHRLR